VEKQLIAKRQAIILKLAALPKNSLPVRKSNRCWVTGRSRAVYRDFGLSRHVIREMAYEGLIPGLKKSSW
jgi:small subunit ribosomal protein S14